MASKKPSKDWEGPSLRSVLLGMTFVAVFMGVFAYYRYVTSEKAIMAGMAELESKGRSLDSEGCVTPATSAARPKWSSLASAMNISSLSIMSRRLKRFQEKLTDFSGSKTRHIKKLRHFARFKERAKGHRVVCV